MSAASKPAYEIKEKADRKAKEPPYYNVFLLNDDYTTMDFVVYILERIFHKPSTEATEIMLSVHRKGRGLAGVYVKEIAETKIDAVHRLALEHQFPLRCTIERV